jgi:hypothetical protein
MEGPPQLAGAHIEGVNVATRRTLAREVVRHCLTNHDYVAHDHGNPAPAKAFKLGGYAL